MKNICFIDYDFSVSGGVEKVLYNLANDLKDQANIHIVSICRKEKKPIYRIPNGVNYFAVCNGFPRIRTAVIHSFVPLKSYIKKNHIDVVFLMGYYPVAVALSFKFFVKTKIVFCDHGAIINQIDDKRAVLFRKLGSKLFDKTITLTKRNLQDYKSIFKINDSKLGYIYNYIDDELFNHRSSTYDILSKRIVTVGRFSKEKGFDMMVDVAEMVFKKHPDWTWDVYGNGEEFSVIKNKIADKNLQNHLILKGATDHLYKQYKNYAMYVLPSYREGLPLVLLEAKANRLPIVAFDVITGPREIVQDNQDGFLVPCYNKELMAQKICDLIENQTLRVQFSENSQNNLSLFQKDEIINKWVALIASL